MSNKEIDSNNKYFNLVRLLGGVWPNKEQLVKLNESGKAKDAEGSGSEVYLIDGITQGEFNEAKRWINAPEFTEWVSDSGGFYRLIDDSKEVSLEMFSETHGIWKAVAVNLDEIDHVSSQHGMSAPPEYILKKENTSAKQEYSEYHKDFSGFETVDIYRIHEAYAIQDCSGRLQHSSKKILLAGCRTGGKSKFKDIKEARDTLNSWLLDNKHLNTDKGE